MTVDVTSEIAIERPVDEVASFAADPDNATAWYRNIKSVTWLTERPMRLGSRFQFVAEFVGRTLTYAYEVVEHEPGRILRMTTTDGPFEMETTYTWRAAGEGGTTMSIRNRGRAGGVMGLAAPLVAAAMRRESRADLSRLKAILEEPDR